jgi:hypothetical protein
MYSDLSDADLTTLRDKLRNSLTDRLTKPTVAAGTGRRAEYQQAPQEIRAQLDLVLAEITRRAGGRLRRPIYITDGGRCR